VRGALLFAVALGAGPPAVSAQAPMALCDARHELLVPPDFASATGGKA